VLIVAGACILRLFNINFSGFEELLVMVAFWLYMLGCAHGSFEKSQITADILAVMMRAGRFKDILTLFRSVLTVALCAVLFVWTVQLLIWAIGIETRTPVYRIPMAVGYASMVVGIGLSLFYYICYLLDNIRELYGKYAGGKRIPEKGGAA
jgi:TRAP-type C4-dicarboxylate transport system permease small subunit